MDETGWLIEAFPNGRTEYLTVFSNGQFGWTIEVNNAIRFSRQIDADSVIRVVKTLWDSYIPDNMVASEHQWSRWQKCDITGCKLEATCTSNSEGNIYPFCGKHGREIKEGIEPIYPEVTDLDMESSNWERRKFKRPFAPKTCPQCGMLASEYYGSDGKWNMCWHVNFQGIPCSLVVGTPEEIIAMANPSTFPAS